MKLIYIYFYAILIFFVKPLFAQQASIVEVDKIRFEILDQKIPIIGNLRTKKNTNIMASVEGKIDRVFVEEGDLVKKGQVLARIDYKNYEHLLSIALANEERADSNYEIAKLETFDNKLDLDRMLALKNSSAFNKSKYDKLKTLNDILKSRENVALSELKAAKSHKQIAILNLNKSNTKALYSGIIEEKFIEIGEFVSKGNKMFQLVSNNQLEVVAEVPSFRTFNLNIGDAIKFSTTDGLKLNSAIRAIGKKENSKTRTVKLFLDFDNDNNKLNRSLIVDENVNILIPISTNTSSLTIHKDAILKREGMSLAYIVKEKKVEIRPLKLGEAVGNRFIVLSGVQENDLTVIKGNERLRPGQNISIK
tara:strand:+ start:266 stop:1357 length:1092 start_codon:yes stop_codon:yes gene_type:complete